MIETVKSWLKNLARVYLPVYFYKSDKMNIIYAGYSTGKKNYCFRLLPGKVHTERLLGRRWFWQLRDLIRSPEYDLIISEVSPLTINTFQKSGGYILPVWVALRVNIDRPMDELCNKNVTHLYNDRRRIHKYNMTYELLPGRESLDDFINRFYLPYMAIRYGKEAFINDIEAMWNSCESPSLIAIKESGKVVGMSFINRKRDTLYLLRMGLLDGREEYRQHGVIGATYYFGIIGGQKSGCKYLDLGGTRPFLTDGLTRYKLGLKPEMVPDYSSEGEYWCLWVSKNSSIAVEFLQNNPFIYVDKDFRLTRYDT